MFSSKIIKAICYTILGIACLAAIILIVIGANYFADKEQGAWLFILIGCLLPIFAIISVFPMFALANIDLNLENTKKEIESINAKIDNANNHIFKQNDNKMYCTVRNLPSEKSRNDIKESVNLVREEVNNVQAENENHEVKYPIDGYSEAIEFVNFKYGSNLTVDDKLLVIKAKFDLIDNQTNAFAIFRNKVKLAKSFSEVANAIIMHKTIHDNRK